MVAREYTYSVVGGWAGQLLGSLEIVLDCGLLVFRGGKVLRESS